MIANDSIPPIMLKFCSRVPKIIQVKTFEPNNRTFWYIYVFKKNYS